MDKLCLCVNSAYEVYADLLQAIERLNRNVGDPHIKKWFEGYREGLLNAQERFTMTRSKCCCERTNEAISK